MVRCYVKLPEGRSNTSPVGYAAFGPSAPICCRMTVHREGPRFSLVLNIALVGTNLFWVTRFLNPLPPKFPRYTVGSW